MSTSSSSTEALVVPAERTAAVERRKRQSWFDFGQRLRPRIRLGLGLSAWLVFLVGWHLLATSGFANSALLPGPLQVVSALYELFAERGFAADVWQSVKRIFFSFGLALVIALPLGMLMGAFAPVEAFLNALVSPFRYLPAPSFVPLLLMWLGTGDGQKIALLVLGVVFFLITLIMDNTRAVSPDLIECSRTLGAGRMKVLSHVILPSALPGYFDTAERSDGAQRNDNYKWLSARGSRDVPGGSNFHPPAVTTITPGLSASQRSGGGIRLPGWQHHGFPTRQQTCPDRCQFSLR